uniref:Fimbrinlike protein putative n=1 Tax=Albugo laibachii Nc14 TaxID=890382 RepID=F0WEW9_9STRA|nr:fimbrinlike protein putative [Albugo laibachii Nc14]|eukprot:CCA19751.1 fimbrinlike protein putative [Albugo laibachii Nc14]
MSYQLPSNFLQIFSPKEIHNLKTSFMKRDLDSAGRISLCVMDTVLLECGERDECLTLHDLSVLEGTRDWEFDGEITFVEFMNVVKEFRDGTLVLRPTEAQLTQMLLEEAESSPWSRKPKWPPRPSEESRAIAIQESVPSDVDKPIQKAKWPPDSSDSRNSNSNTVSGKVQWPPRGSQAGVNKSPWPPSSTPMRSQRAHSTQESTSTTPPKPQWPPSNNIALPAQASSTTNSFSESQWLIPNSKETLKQPLNAPRTPTASNDSNKIKVIVRGRKFSWPAERKGSNPSQPSYSVTKTGSGPHSSSVIHEVRGSAGGVHSYSEAEKTAFTEHINNCLGCDSQLSHLLPVSTDDDGLFLSVADGVLLCKLLNEAVPETIDSRAINLTTTKALNVYEMTENLNLCINAAKSIGCSVVNIGPADLIEGKPILVLGLVWQIIKIQLTSTINLKNHPELVRLLLDGESLEEFMRLPPDQILLRWMNYHLQSAGHPNRISNFSGDVKDAHAYSVLLHHIAPNQCDLCTEQTAQGRATHVIQNARKLQVETFIKPHDITNGNPKLNMSFVAQLFNTCPSLDVVEADMKKLKEILYDDVGDTREERVFRMWINSMGIDGLHINHLFSDVRDGIALLKVFDRIEKGVVQWSKVHMNAPNTYQKVENCNYCVDIGKGAPFQFSLVNIGGADIFGGNKKLILSIMWQSMRHQQLKILTSLAQNGGHPITDKDIIEWANGKVQQSGRSKAQMSAFRDGVLSNGIYLLDLVHAVESRAVNWDQVTSGETDEEKVGNAKYAISCAQKVGATVFLTYEDIVEVKPKMISTFVASLMSIDLKIAQT